jgi:hypothetical protein
MSYEEFIASLPEGWENSPYIGFKSGDYSTYYTDAMYYGRVPKPFKCKNSKQEIYKEFNPVCKIIEHEGFKIIQDGILPGGTKQRAAVTFLKTISARVVVYAGPSSGLAQIALSLAAPIANKEFIMFTDDLPNPLKDLGKKYSKYYEFAAPLKIIAEKARDFCTQTGAELLPFGLESMDFKNILAGAIREAVKFEAPRRLWVVAGSATLLNALYCVFPNTFFCTLQVGRKIWWDQIDLSRTKLFKETIPFNKPAEDLPPYESIITYDAKIWKWVKKYGEPGDYIWNVGAFSY